MAQPVIPPPGFDRLSVEEKIEYVQSLWDSIAAGPDDVPVPEWHAQVARERLEAYRANPHATESWDQVRQKLEERLTQPDKK